MERLLGLGADRADLGLRPQRDRRAVHVLPARGARRRGAGHERHAAGQGRRGRRRALQEPATASATSAWPTPRGQRRQAAHAQRRGRQAQGDQDAEVPAVAVRVARAAGEEAEQEGLEVRRLDPHQLRGRQGHRQGRRGAGVQREEAAKKTRRRSSGRDGRRAWTRPPSPATVGPGPARRAHARRAGLRRAAVRARDGRLRVPRGVAVVPAQRVRLVRPRRQRRPADRGDLHVGQLPPGAGLHLPRLADDLGHHPGDRLGHRPELRRGAVHLGLHRRVRARAGCGASSSRSCACWRACRR